ncbi:xanthine dehydrogenase accessory protein XdhC [Undibacterium sp. 14-3-2]|uniref:xanthine dehydrogenase accessory protein XdhC n=1 Tax=Undibacterium sp. 14-3-2 TaxID=2800129 RepID=UPI001904E215|nr:xanthine dehydrogenase accessory protein XdhC [Undibacterium sp. 14-3-2]MBK1888640.1 xanthine dehydrogenase accessory protein XdhC [Undibacterium sp. 14-3-2]
MPINSHTSWLESLQALPENAPAILITVTAAKGSTPRGTGTRMLVTAQHQYDTIGGGHLEWKAIAHARLWLAESAEHNAAARHLDLALGPSLGQCCGGAVSIMLERTDSWTTEQKLARYAEFQQQQAQLPHLYLFGAGHVGSALVNVLQQTPCRITWVDERDHLFPAHLPLSVQTEATDCPEAVVVHAEAGAYFLVMTHHHGLDLLLSEHILRKNDVAWFGLIGSQTKRARFEHRLRERQISAARLATMVCPAGIDGITGKEPGVIAIAIAAQLLQLWAKTPTLPDFASITHTAE